MTWNVAFFASLVKIFHRLTAVFLVLHEVVITTRCDAFEFLCAEWEFKDDVCRSVRVVCEFFFCMFVQNALPCGPTVLRSCSC